MDTVHEVVSFFTNQPVSTYTTILSYLGGSTLVASILQVVKHKFSLQEAKSLVTFLLGLFSFVAAFADYIISATSQNPTALGRNTAAIVAGAVFIHRFAVGPLYTKLVVNLTNLVKDANAYRASVAQVAAPAETQIQVQEFQV